MLNTLVLQSFKSFGSRQTVNLQPISVLVGANNSGKSNLMSVGRLVRTVTTSGWEAALQQEGEAEFLFHQSPAADQPLHISWTVDTISQWRKLGGGDS